MDILRLHSWRSTYNSNIAIAGPHGCAYRSIFCLRTPLNFSVFQVLWVLCRNRRVTWTHIFSIHFRATPIESGHWLVGSCGIAIILPTTLTTRRQSDLQWEISLCALCPNLVSSVRICFSLLLSNCDCGKQSNHRTVCDAVPEPPSAAWHPTEPGDLFEYYPAVHHCWN